MGAGLAVKQDTSLLLRWSNGDEVKFGNARDWLTASPEGKTLDALAAPGAVFDRAAAGAWLVWLYERVCGYAHSRAGVNDIDFWESNSHVHVWGVLDRIIAETRDSRHD